MNGSLSVKFKQLFSHGIIYGLTSSLQSILSFVLLPVLASFYSTEEFGVYSLLLVMGAFASSVFYLGASSALGRYYYEEDSIEYKRVVISSAFQLTAFGALLLILLATLFASNISSIAFQTIKYSLHIKLAFYGVGCTFLLNLLTLILRYDNKSKLFMVVTITSVLLNFLITYILLSYYNYGILAPLTGLFISNLVSFLILLVYIREHLDSAVYPVYLFKLLSFGIPALVTSLLFYVLDLADRFIIKDLLNISEVGVYSVAYKVASIVNVLLIAPFGLIWAPFRMQNSKNELETKILMVKVTSYMFIIGFLIILFTLLYGRSLMAIFFDKPEFLEAAQIIPILIMGIFLFGIQNILDYGINLHKKLHYYIMTSICGILFNIVANYTFIPMWGLKGAAFATMFTYFLTTTLIFIFSSKFFKVSLEWNRIVSPFIYLSVLMAVFHYFPSTRENVLIGMVFFLLSLYVVFKFWLTNSERQFLK